MIRELAADPRFDPGCTALADLGALRRVSGADEARSVADELESFSQAFRHRLALVVSPGVSCRTTR